MDNIIIKTFKSNSQNNHTWVALDSANDFKVVGHVYLLVESANHKVKFMDGWVDEEYRGRGIYKKLFHARLEFAQENFRGFKAYAWCKETSLNVALGNGFHKGEICTYVEKEL